ncbi:hypothetical protein H4696_005483 [Amycolatopsis lexingtonensis]|uniref:Uncharacterized protein n=1 Tax=Amycolatopsis lexingtonensis TaxID=218822 RepID=A0ABR9I5B2_9PSEU|nr:hypothetical protein [Amycolatopsis lexingtonensis]MBE1498383.1 hypothetical protein [Amycolatopsis lexingtonensis]
MSSNPNDTSNSHSGDNSENVVQAGTVNTLNFYNTPRTETPEAESTTSTWNPSKVAVATIAILGGLWLLPSPEDADAIPAESGARPAGSSNEAVLTAVQASLTSCAQTPVLQPANCPQKIDDPTGQANDVHWALHGNPTDGTYGPIWSNDRFYVAGYAVMTVTYTTPYRVPSPQNLSVEAVPYRAEITWTDNKPTVVNLRRYDTIDNQRVAKKDPGLPPVQATQALRKAFDQCVAAKQAPMPPQCPQSSMTQPSDHATWTLNGNPVTNTKQTFDPTTGLTHITGSYSATATTHNDFLGMTYDSTDNQSGNYDASLIATGPTLQVLQIKATP